MNCTILEARLSDYLDGMLAQGEQRLVEAHLASCDSCRQLYESMEEVLDWGRNFPVFEAPEWLVTRILANTPRKERETWVDTLGALGRWVLDTRTAMAVFTSMMVLGWISNTVGIAPSLADLRSPAAIYRSAGDLVNDAYDGAVRLYYSAPLVTQIQSQIEQLRESS